MVLGLALKIYLTFFSETVGGHRTSLDAGIMGLRTSFSAERSASHCFFAWSMVGDTWLMFVQVFVYRSRLRRGTTNKCLSPLHFDFGN